MVITLLVLFSRLLIGGQKMKTFSVCPNIKPSASRHHNSALRLFSTNSSTNADKLAQLEKRIVQLEQLLATQSAVNLG
jgi:hypothetical protein